MEPIVFKHWSNRKYAVLQSLKSVIRIATLSVAYTMLQAQPVLGQSDTISPSMIFELEEVETTGEAEPELYSTALRQLAVIQQDQINSSGAISHDQLLDYLPGVDIRTRGMYGVQSDLSIQGGSFDQSLVLLNGINFSNPQTGHFNLDLPLSLSQTYKIEVLKGSATRVYGKNAYSGAVNFLTKPADSLSFTGDILYGQHNLFTSTLTLHLPLGKSRNMLSTSISGSDGYRQNTDFDSKNIFFHSSRDVKKFSKELFIGWNQKSFGANAFYTPLYPEQYEETSSLLAGLKISSNSNPKVSANVYGKRHRDHFLLFRNNPSAYENYHMSDIAGGEIAGEYSSMLGHSSAKLRFRHERIFSTTLGETLESDKFIEPKEDFYTKFSSRNYVSVIFDHDLQLKKLYISIGSLLNLDTDNYTLLELYPGIDASYSFNRQNSAFLSFNRSMRLPSFTDLYYNGPQNKGNPNLLPEKAFSAETGVKFRNKNYEIKLSAFYRLGKETIDWVWIDNLWQSRNITELNTYGLECSGVVYPGKINESFRFIQEIKISYGYTEISKSSDEYISNYALDKLKHKALVNVKWNLPYGFYIISSATLYDRNGTYLHYETATSTPYEKDYERCFLLDLTAGIKIKHVNLFLNGTNLLDIEYRDIGAVPMPGRWISLGIKFMP